MTKQKSNKEIVNAWKNSIIKINTKNNSSIILKINLFLLIWKRKNMENLTQTQIFTKLSCIDFVIPWYFTFDHKYQSFLSITLSLKGPEKLFENSFLKNGKHEFRFEALFASILPYPQMQIRSKIKIRCLEILNYEFWRKNSKIVIYVLPQDSDDTRCL